MVLRVTVDSFAVSKKPSEFQLMTLAHDLVAKYTCESLEDFILAFKETRTSGVKTYNMLDTSKLYGFFDNYLNERAKFLENRHFDLKAQGASQDAAVAKAIADVPQIATMIKGRLDPKHINHQTLRSKLTIIKGREEHSLITPEQAAAQRAEVEAANYRHATRRESSLL